LRLSIAQASLESNVGVRDGSQFMKRHRSLVPLSHDHHQALVQARRLKRGKESSDPSTVARTFLGFFAEETVRHFREEEELVFPAVLDCPSAHEPLIQALLQHERLHALTKLLREGLDTGRPITPIMQKLGDLLVAHVRHEERCLFPLIEEFVDDSTLAAIELAPSGSDPVGEPPRAQRDVSRETAPTGSTTTLYWGNGGGPHCDAAFLRDRCWDAKDPQRW
jgi:iron-sulfur cluster repair protein YtfE (RIC family)